MELEYFLFVRVYYENYSVRRLIGSIWAKIKVTTITKYVIYPKYFVICLGISNIWNNKRLILLSVIQLIGEHFRYHYFLLVNNNKKKPVNWLFSVFPWLHSIEEVLKFSLFIGKKEKPLLSLWLFCTFFHNIFFLWSVFWVLGIML